MIKVDTSKIWMSFTEDERRLIFSVLTNYTEQLAKVEDEHDIINTKLRDTIIKINDLAYDNFNA
mgnify:CR=1 FL=1